MNVSFWTYHSETGRKADDDSKVVVLLIKKQQNFCTTLPKQRHQAMYADVVTAAMSAKMLPRFQLLFVPKTVSESNIDGISDEKIFKEYYSHPHRIILNRVPCPVRYCLAPSTYTCRRMPASPTGGKITIVS